MADIKFEGKFSYHRIYNKVMLKLYCGNMKLQADKTICNKT